MRNLDPTTRAYAYRTALFLIAALIVFDVVSGGDARTWVVWIGGALGLGASGLASANTSVRKDRR